MAVSVRLLCVTMWVGGLATCGYPPLDPLRPEGTHHEYVVNRAFLPTTPQQAPGYGLDLGTPTSGTPDGTVDNRIGVMLGTLAEMGFKIKDTLDTAISQGNILLLVDFQARDLMNASAAGFSIKLGASPIPAACNGATDTICGHHLTGTASFSIAADSPPDAPLVGKIVDNRFNGGPGEISLQIVLGDATQPLTLSLVNARAKTTAINGTGLTAIIGGALSVNDLNTQVIPAIAAQMTRLLVRDCSTNRTRPTCGCSASSTGALLLNLFDGDLAGMLADCNITKEEIAGNSVIKNLLGPDVCSTTTCTDPDALSFGITIETANATLR